MPANCTPTWLFYHGLINRVGGLIGKDAGGQAGNKLDDANCMCCHQHVIIDVDIVSLEETGTSVATNTNLRKPVPLQIPFQNI